MWAVVGLGNPGLKYSRTRHNVGFLFVKGLAQNWGTKLRKRRHLSKLILADHHRERILLAIPQTFMNASGLAVDRLLENYQVKPAHTLIVYDDFDLALGEIRIRKEGSAGSHKGMRSVIQELGTSQIPRLRIGIGPLPETADPVEFVLSPFTKEERLSLEQSLNKACEAVELILAGDIEKAMNLYN
ncbi:MAG: aminoacyl-tRNA hydrolase [Candidatus Aminicenantes bacterium]|nr:aminoacyl-tRNA hydrolase [Candidatus Aminicenantes bacterium]